MLCFFYVTVAVLGLKGCAKAGVLILRFPLVSLLHNSLVLF